ncbi:bifunctional glutamate/proline--tRNA ligase [Cimex lectularius]|uniref:Bifunctional glutamate/proline--tRNA ligase n=1 Tax=Cimex lectularius TaxID=79782 RepID=A0A8I6S1T0_CIMLE|nr:bifunctional glutamate/proline--tRNA ligase [Cimex lectularius]
MELCANTSKPPLPALFLLNALKKQPSVKWGSETVLRSNGLSLKSDFTIVRYLALSDKEGKWFGSHVLDESEVNHWVSFSIGPLSYPDEFQDAVAYLDHKLKPLTYFVANQLTLADIAVFSQLLCSSNWHNMVKENKSPPNLIRWFNLISNTEFVKKTIANLPDSIQLIQKEISGRKEEGKFVDLPNAEMGKVIVRFPPEASGYLHIGHAKAALLNQYYKEAFNGKLIMRFDDTNPAKEKVDFEKVILEDLKLLKISYDIFSHTSNYFDVMLEMCERLLKQGKAYVDDTDPEVMKTEREQKVTSKNWANSVQKNFEMWQEMLKGTAYGQKCCVRAKIDMNSLNGCMRDPTIYRCKNEPHPKTGNKYKVYPTYDFACPIVDSIEGVTHCLRTMEYHDRDEQFYWFIDALGLRKPYIWEYSRLNMVNTVLSKRKLTWIVDNKYVTGWDDPRMPTVRGIIRRGMTVEGLKQFIISQGSSRSVVVMEWDKIWAINKKVIDPIAPRYTAVSKDNHVVVHVEGVKEEFLKVAKHPKNPAVGEKMVLVGPEVIVDKADAEVFKEGENVTFINWGNILIKKVVRQNGEVTEVKAVSNLEDKNFKKTLKITWLAKSAKASLIPCYCLYFDNIISKPILGKDEDFKDYISKDTMTVVETYVDPDLASLKQSDIIQLQRKGFFICDRKYHPLNEYTGEDCPLALIAIPDGHTKEMPTASAAMKTAVKAPTPAPATLDSKELSDQITSLGNKIREMKASKASKDDVSKEVKLLVELKASYKHATGHDWKPINVTQGTTDSSSAVASNQVEELTKKVKEQGDVVRELKAKKSPKSEIDAAVSKLLSLKGEYKQLTGNDFPVEARQTKSANKEKNEPKIQPSLASVESEQLNEKITQVGNKIREMKSAKASKEDITKEVNQLLQLKASFKVLTGVEWKPVEKKTVPQSSSQNNQITELTNKIKEQGNLVKALKSKSAPKEEITAANILLSLKGEYKQLTGNDYPTDDQLKDLVTEKEGSKNKETSEQTTESVKLSDKITQVGNKIREMKAHKADKEEIGKEVKQLLELKASYKQLTGQEWNPATAKQETKPKPQSQPQTQTTKEENNQVAELTKKIKEQGDTVRALKSTNSPKDEVNSAVNTLLSLKAEYKQLTGNDFPVESRQNKSSNKGKNESRNAKSKVEQKKETDSAVKKVTRLGLEAEKETNLPEWYSQVLVKGEMIEYYDVSGCYILRPWSFSIWENIKNWLDVEIKKLGVKNCYFPIFVSRSVLEKEKTHISDFAPEVAWVTKSGDSDLAEPIAVRPTSETVMYPAYAKWIQSYRDLPIKLNQWNNVVRWEFKHPQPFLRTREFLWQEGHTAFATYKEAEDEVYTILDLYAKVYTELLAIPVVKGRKTEKEKFAGGDYTLTVEAFISASGRAIQGGTSHHLGHNFSKMFSIVYEDPETQEKKFVYQNSWGITTRTIGVMIMVHADNQGLVLPPRVASLQVVIVPCGITVTLPESDKNKLIETCEQLKSELVNAGVRAETDVRDNYSPGWKFNHWELKGVPLRIEIGPKDIQKAEIVAVRRDTLGKTSIPMKDAVSRIASLLETIQSALLQKATDDLNNHMVVCKDWKSFCEHLDNNNIIQAPFCGEIDCEDNIKTDSARNEDVDSNAPSMGAKSLCIPFTPLLPHSPEDKCVHPKCSKNSKYYTLFGRSY